MDRSVPKGIVRAGDSPHRPTVARSCRRHRNPGPKNVLRHSFCSYHLADRKDENLTAVEAGNSPAMIFNHYRALIRREEDITAFWALSLVGANAQSST